MTTPGPLGRPPGFWRREAALLPSTLTTVALVFWASERFYHTSPSGVFAGRRSAAFFIILLLALAVIRLLQWCATRRTEPGMGEGLRWAFLQLLAAWALHPYVRGAQVGAGDAYHYSLMLADFTGQLRAGVFPVFVGQTAFAFNGNVHTLRTAPLFEHLGGLLDVLTLRTLPSYALLNALLLSSAVLGAVGAYAALRIYIPGRRWTAAGVAGLYLLCPGVLAPLLEGDMVATFLTVPILPWMVLGLAEAVDDATAWWPWLLQAAALAALWWAHPPVAFWASSVVLGAWILLLAFRRADMGTVLRMLVSAGLIAALSAYVFVSVAALGIPVDPNVSQDAQARAIVANLALAWPGALRPTSPDGSVMLSDIQLGYPLLIGALTAGFAVRARRSAGFLLGALVGMLVLVFPVPGVAGWFWSRVPAAVLTVTNSWPMQRFYIVMAALAGFAALAGLARFAAGSRLRTSLAAVALLAALAWSAREARKLQVRSEAGGDTPESSARSHRPENVVLTRSSYLIFNSFPSYFSNGHMEPFMETRLLDPRSFSVIADGSTRASGSAAAEGQDYDLRPSGRSGFLEREIPMAGGGVQLLHFDFLGRQPAAELQISGGNFHEAYTLPSSGLAKSFGAGPTNRRVLALGGPETAAGPLRLTFVFGPGGTSAPGAGELFGRVTIEPLSAAPRAVELQSVLPFVATVRTPAAAILETPKIFIPGYRATVDGRAVRVLRTGEGLVGVPVPAGSSEVRVDYPGGASLRWAYVGSLEAWLGLAAFAVLSPALNRRGGLRRRLEWTEAAARREIRRWRLPAAIALAILAGGIWVWQRVGAPASGPLRMVVMLHWRPAGESEPLVTTGRMGAGDVVFVRFLGDGRVCVGYDKWSRGGPVSAPFAVDFTTPQTIEVAMTSLFPGGTPTNGAGTGHLPRLWVKWNGREVLSSDAESYPAGPGGVEIGANRIGASSCGPVFTGEILQAVRQP